MRPAPVTAPTTTSASRNARQSLPKAPHADFNMNTLRLEAPIATLRSLGAISPESIGKQLPGGLQSTALQYNPVRRGVVTEQEAQRAVHMSVCHSQACCANLC